MCALSISVYTLHAQTKTLVSWAIITIIPAENISKKLGKKSVKKRLHQLKILFKWHFPVTSGLNKKQKQKRLQTIDTLIAI